MSAPILFSSGYLIHYHSLMQMAEAALGKEMFEQILQVNAGDLRVDP